MRSNLYIMQADTAHYITGTVRIITGALLVYHGMEVFDNSIMNNYLSWEKIKALPMPVLLVYAGKISELAGGIAMVLGWRTRWAAATIMMVMLLICFYLGQGKFWYEDQHPFVIALLCALYLFGSPGAWAMDNRPTRTMQNDAI